MTRRSAFLNVSSPSSVIFTLVTCIPGFNHSGGTTGDTELSPDFGGKILPIGLRGAVHEYLLDGADRTHGFRMRERLPPRTKYPENGRILPREESSRQRAARCDSQSLNESIRKDCQRFAALSGK